MRLPDDALAQNEVPQNLIQYWPVQPTKPDKKVKDARPVPKPPGSQPFIDISDVRRHVHAMGTPVRSHLLPRSIGGPAARSQSGKRPVVGNR